MNRSYPDTRNEAPPWPCPVEGCDAAFDSKHGSRIHFRHHADDEKRSTLLAALGDLHDRLGRPPTAGEMDVFEARFNTSGNTLTGVYEELLGNGLIKLDPFTDSEEAVEAWEEGAFESLVFHNVADIRRTWALMR